MRAQVLEGSGRTQDRRGKGWVLSARGKGAGEGRGKEGRRARRGVAAHSVARQPGQGGTRSGSGRTGPPGSATRRGRNLRRPRDVGTHLPDALEAWTHPLPPPQVRRRVPSDSRSSGPTVPKVHGLCRPRQREAKATPRGVLIRLRSQGGGTCPASGSRATRGNSAPSASPRQGAWEREAPAGGGAGSLRADPEGGSPKRAGSWAGGQGPGARAAGIGGSQGTGPRREWTDAPPGGGTARGPAARRTRGLTCPRGRNRVSRWVPRKAGR